MKWKWSQCRRDYSKKRKNDSQEEDRLLNSTGGFAAALKDYEGCQQAQKDEQEQINIVVGGGGYSSIELKLSKDGGHKGSKRKKGNMNSLSSHGFRSESLA